jgi:[protein-PII] uridylyltransferase
MTAPESPTADEIGAFVASLPKSYAQKYATDEIGLHLAVAARRGSGPVSVGLLPVGQSPAAQLSVAQLPVSQSNPATLCVIAEDRPGLLATISGALILCGFDVVDAEAYTRKLDHGHFEAMDLFWVRRQGSAGHVGAPAEPVTAADAQRLEATLSDILLGKQRFPTMPPLGEVGPPEHASDTRVRFIEDKSGGLSVLEVETGDRSGLLWLLSRALFERNVQIITSQVSTKGGRVFDRFTVVELDGSPIGDARRLEIQVAVLSAIEPARRKSVLPAEHSPS